MVIYKASITGVTKTEQFEFIATLTQDNLHDVLKSTVEVFIDNVSLKSEVKNISINLIKTEK